VHLTKLTYNQFVFTYIYSQDKFLTRFISTYYLSRICTFDLVKVWIFPNSTVCISLLEQIFELQLMHQKSFWWAAFINNVAIYSRNFRGWQFFLQEGQLKEPGYYEYEPKKSQAFFQK